MAYMMQEIRRGITMATSSLLLIWQDLFLLAFIAIPLILTVATDLIAYNILVTQSDNSVINYLGLSQLINEVLRGPHWLHIAIGVFFLFLKVAIGMTFMAALVVYSASELKGKILTFARSFVRLKSHWHALLAWALIGTFENIMVYQVMGTGYPVATRAAAMIMLSFWYFASWLVLPLIILEHNTIVRAIISSLILVKEKLWLILGGALWLLGLSIIPSLLFDVLDRSSLQLGAGPYLFIAALAGLLIVKSYILTAETLLKTMVYQSFYKR